MCSFYFLFYWSLWKKLFFLSDAVSLSDLSQVHVGLFTPSWTWSFCHLLLFVPPSKYLSLQNFKMPSTTVWHFEREILKTRVAKLLVTKGVDSFRAYFLLKFLWVYYTSVFTTKLFSSSAPDGLGWIVMLFQLLVKMINCSSTLLSGYTDQKARGE